MVIYVRIRFRGLSRAAKLDIMFPVEFADCYTEMAILEYDIEMMLIRKVLLSRAKAYKLNIFLCRDKSVHDMGLMCQ